MSPNVIRSPPCFLNAARLRVLAFSSWYTQRFWKSTARNRCTWLSIPARGGGGEEEEGVAAAEGQAGWGWVNWWCRGMSFGRRNWKPLSPRAAVKITKKSKTLIHFASHKESRLLYFRVTRVNRWDGWIYGIIYQLKTPKLNWVKRRTAEIKKEIIRKNKQIFLFSVWTC